MDSPLITALLQGLKSAPDNIQLQQALVDAYKAENRLEPALEILQTMVSKDSQNISTLDCIIDVAGKLERTDLVTAYGALKSSVIVPLSDNTLQNNSEVEELVSEDNDKRVRGAPLQLVTDQGANITSIEDDEFEDPNIYLDDVGGMEEVKRRLRISFLAPLKNPELVKQYGKSVGGGLILYGPPGCGKTYIARALAGELGAKFISIGLSDILDMYVGESERKLHEIFESARRNSPAVLFIDELDALGQKRSNLKHSGMRTLVNQLLNEMDSVDNNNENLFILGATNHPWEIDDALKRPGRFDRMVAVFPPDLQARESILKHHLKSVPVENINIRDIAQQSRLFSGADLSHLCKSAIDQVFERSLETQVTEKITAKDFLSSFKDVKPTTLTWFDSAKNYALFSNKGGQYDEILTFIKENKL